MDRRSRISQINSKYTGPSHSPSRIIVSGTPIVSSPIGGVTTVRRSRIGTSAIAGGALTSGIISGASHLRTSKIVTPPVYEVVNNPPIYEVITTPPRVYEIVTPVIDVTPDTVVQQRQTTVNHV